MYNKGIPKKTETNKCHPFPVYREDGVNFSSGNFQIRHNKRGQLEQLHSIDAF